MRGMVVPDEVLTRGPVRLRRVRSGDLAAVHRVVTESLTHLRPWMPWAAGDYDRAAAAEFLAAAERGWATGAAYNYAITVADALVGVCGLEHRAAAEPDRLDIGYWLHPAHTGRGLATMAAAALVDQGLTLPGIGRLQVWHDLANVASAGVPRRLGFTEIGRRARPRDPVTPGEVGIDVGWQLAR